jgi:hypothetical protein
MVRKKPVIKLLVEGGGDYTELHNECREGFHKFLMKAGFEGKMPRIVACGSRLKAYDIYKTALRNNELAVLLVGEYSKGRHSFEILERINPDAVVKKSPWANRFICLLHKKMDNR